MNRTSKRASTSVLFEMLGSFVSLARNLNLSKTTAELGISRQTVRRHINDLESLRGQTFFSFDDRRYWLTEHGRSALIEAQFLLQRAEYWTSGKSNAVNGLVATNQILDDGTPFYSQRHPLKEIWNKAPPLIVEGFSAWAMSAFKIEAVEMEHVRPYLVVHRKRNSEWICTEIGGQSSFASWLGWNWAQSVIGTTLQENPVSSGAETLVLESFDTVDRTGSIWYDHVFTRLRREIGGQKLPVSYQRLAFCCEFPDGKPAVATLVARTNKVEIDNLSSEIFEAMPDADLMEFAIKRPV